MAFIGPMLFIYPIVDNPLMGVRQLSQYHIMIINLLNKKNLMLI
jgi:hypothetical protein